MRERLDECGVSWLPDGQGLGELRDLIAEAGDRVHMRLTASDRYPVTACHGGLGEWWTGKASEVTCPACLEVVHA